MSESNNLSNFKNITVAGSGVLGYQIAVQAAFHGFKVVVYDINDEVLIKPKPNLPISPNVIRMIWAKQANKPNRLSKTCVIAQT